jgi:hypothetical protein
MGNYDKYIPKAVEKGGTKYLSGNYSEVAHGLGAYTERIEHHQQAKRTNGGSLVCLARQPMSNAG